MYPITVVKAGKGTHYCARKSSYKPSYGKDFSVLGNPHWMQSESQRDKVCDRYEVTFKDFMVRFPEFRSAVLQIVEDSKVGPVALECFCSSPENPKRCHCDTIRSEVLRLREEVQKPFEIDISQIVIIHELRSLYNSNTDTTYNGYEVELKSGELVLFDDSEVSREFMIAEWESSE